MSKPSVSPSNNILSSDFPREDNMNSKLYHAASEGQLDLVKNLISEGADDLDGALIIAAKKGNIELSRLLISRGAIDLNKALAKSAKYGHKNLVDVLVSIGADDIGWAFSESVKTGNSNFVEYMYSLLENNIMFSLSDSYTPKHREGLRFEHDHWIGSALIKASGQGHLEIVKFVLTRILTPNSLEMALQNAILGNHLEIVSLLQNMLILMKGCRTTYEDY